MEEPSLFSTLFGATWVYAYWAVWATINIASAYFVYQAAIRRERAALNIGPYWWALFTLVSGIWALLIYWLIEHSTLSGKVGHDS